ncbi:MAG: hypothetical protein GF410_01860 [Chitinivibrionales bacterium]|nr:hypothetical protein [Chitinivibrionales bacterium]
MSPIWIVIGKVLGALVDVLTPHIRELLEKWLYDLYEKALKTDNPADDTLIEFLAALLRIELSE